MVLHAIVYQRRAAALSTPYAAALAPHIAVLEADHPTARWVGAMLLYSELIHHGCAPEPFDSSHAAAFASMVLLPDEAVAPLAHLPDAELAERFNVPVEEIARKRLELDALGLTDAVSGGAATRRPRRRPWRPTRPSRGSCR